MIDLSDSNWSADDEAKNDLQLLEFFLRDNERLELIGSWELVPSIFLVKAIAVVYIFNNGSDECGF